MITKEDVKALNIYFKSLETIPEDLVTIAQKIDLMDEIQTANDNLMKLMKDGE